jgi:hypothetical protein
MRFLAMLGTIIVSAIVASPTMASHRPITFVENRGQFDRRVLFCTTAGDATIWFTSDGVYHQFIRSDGADSIDYMILKQTFVGAADQVRVEGIGRVSEKSHFLIGNDPAQWCTNVSRYASIIYRNIYPGIDLKYYVKDSQLEYDLILIPGEDPAQIAIRYDGVREVRVDDSGNLVLSTPWGELLESKPAGYLLAPRQQTPVEVKYALIDSVTVRFALPKTYESGLALVIDPVLRYSTFLGGSSIDYIADVAIDSSGNALVTGQTFSLNFPTVKPWQGSRAADYDLFVSKINPEGDSVLYSTYIGGNGSDEGLAIAGNRQGNSCVAGWTSSTDFPAVGALQPQNRGGRDAFLLRLSSGGDSLLYSTYLGGNGQDRASDLALDNLGDILLTGYTSSSDFPAVGAFQDTLSGSAPDAFVCKINSITGVLLYATYFGGADRDEGAGIVVGAAGEAVVVGTTSSVDFPVQNALQDSLAGGSDLFVARLDSAGASLQHSAYLGGRSEDVGKGIAIGSDGSLYLTGQTRSSDFPIAGAFRDSCRGCPAYSDAFVTRLAASGRALVFSSYLGGNLGEDVGRGIVVDRSGYILVVGRTASDDFPVIDPLQAVRWGGSDAFITLLSGNGSGLLFSSFWGGSNDDEAYAVALVGSGDALVAGRTGSGDYPLSGAYQSQFGGGSTDGFVARISLGLPQILCGDLDGSGQINVSDLVYVVNYIFADGPAPVDSGGGDVNCDGIVSLADAVHLVNYIFGDGAPPCHGC